MAFAPDVSFRLENFRAFKDSGVLQLRPLTFLVGENSAGKSSLLAALNYILRFRQGTQKSSFNSPPFELGGFDQIVFSRKGVPRPDCFEFEVRGTVDLNDPALVFRFGSEEPGEPDPQLVVAHLTFKSYFGEPRISQIRFELDGLTLVIRADQNIIVEIDSADGRIYPLDNEQQRLPMELGTAQSIDPQTLTYILSQTLYSATYSSPTARRNPRSRQIERIVAGAQGLSDILPHRIIANAPTRSSPSRVYNPSDFPSSPTVPILHMY